MAGFSASPLRPTYQPTRSTSPFGGASSVGSSPIYANGYVSPQTPGAVQVPIPRGANGLPAYRMPQQTLSPGAGLPTPSYQPTAGTSPVDRMKRTSVTTSTGPAEGYEDLNMSDYYSALGPMKESPREVMPSLVGPMSMANRTAAESAAYGRARDQVGQESRGALDSLSDEMSARGLAGAGLEGALTAGILQKGQGQLGEVNRDQAIDRMKRQDQIQSENYQGNITQRAQDMSFKNAQRGLDIESQNARSSNAMRLMELLRRRRQGQVTTKNTSTTETY